jgi:hypothetical protein
MNRETEKGTERTGVGDKKGAQHNKSIKIKLKK